MSPVLLNPSRFGTGGVTGYAGAVLADAPLWYARQDDTSGTTMTDSSGNGHNGTYSGTVTLNQASLLTGDANPSVDYGGGSGTVAGASWMNGSGLTVEAIIRPDTLGSYNFIVSRDVNGTAGPWWMALKAGKVSFFCRASSAIEFLSLSTLSAATTYHLACTFDNTTQRIYINGVEDRNQALAGSLSVNTVDLIIGTWPSGPLPFDGRIDEVALYGTVLSAARIAAHAALV